MTSKARLASETAVVVVAVLLGVWAAGADLAWFERHVAPRYCIDLPTWPWQAVRAVAAGIALLLVLVVRPRIGRVVATWPARELAVTSAGVVVALVAALGVGELVLRRIRWDDRQASEHDDLPGGQPDARLGWTFRPSQTRSVGGVEYAIDEHGDRAPRAGARVDAAAPALVVTGESAAFGFELAWDETFPALVGRALGLQVVNVAVPAYGTDQAYLRMVDALPRLAAPRLVVLVFVPQEIRRNISPIRAHFVVGADGALSQVPAATGLAAWRLPRLFGDEPFHGAEPIRLTRAILDAAAGAARARGAEPLFVVTNYGPACRGDDPYMVRQLFAGLPHVRVELTDADIFSPADPHPNPRGAKKIAEAVLGAVGR
jgi:hypothetical protein